uniref:BAG domain-containing protein n=1 Tax=Oryza punctata TaxID=4537 RepID=A0A0E0MFP9_ORYPU
MARRSFGGYGKNRPCSTLRQAATSPEEEEAAVLALQAAARGLLARRAVRALAVAEELMRLLLRLDAVRGARAYRRRVVARVLALQDAVDAGGAA